MSVNTAFWHPREQTADCRAHRGITAEKLKSCAGQSSGTLAKTTA